MGHTALQISLTPEDVDIFFSALWKVHYNSDRTGVRLIGPKPRWARKDGGEAGLHPSNIHDNAYAVGTIDFTGDMPVILGPDGPSLGGFVCPATIVGSRTVEDRTTEGRRLECDSVPFRSGRPRNYSLGLRRCLECLDRELPRRFQSPAAKIQCCVTSRN